MHADREQERDNLKNDVNVVEGHSRLWANLGFDTNKFRRTNLQKRLTAKLQSQTYLSGEEGGAMVLTLIVFAGTPPTT